MERAVLVDLVLTGAFLGFAAYFLWIDRLIAAGIWTLVAVGFGARGVGLLPRA